MLWDRGDDAVVVGWVNVTHGAGRRVVVDAGYVDRRPAGIGYRQAFDAEVGRLERFLATDEPVDDDGG